MKKPIYFLFLFVLSCSGTQVSNPNVDPQNCFSACEKIGPRGLNCPEGDTLEDGTTCTKFCEETQNSGHALNAGCIMTKVEKCSDISDICGQ